MMLSMLASVLVLVGAYQPAEDPAREAEVRDRVQYRTLSRQIREVDREYERAVTAAMGEARDAPDGEAGLAKQAEVLALRDKRDRLVNRLMLLSLRHGWEMPDFSAEGPGDGSTETQEGTQEIFAASAAVLRERFADEARTAASLVEMPIVPLIVER